MEPRDLAGGEQSFLVAVRTGRPANLQSGVAAEDDPVVGMKWGPARTVRADVLAEFLLGSKLSDPRSGSPVELRGARIEGRLDLREATLSRSLRLAYCFFEERPTLREAQVVSLDLE